MEKQKINGKNILAFISLLHTLQINSINEFDDHFIGITALLVKRFFGIDEKVAVCIVKEYIKIGPDIFTIVSIDKNKRNGKQSKRLYKVSKLAQEMCKIADKFEFDIKAIINF